MSLETDVFKRRDLDEDRLIEYGFERKGDALFLRRPVTQELYAVLSYKCGEIGGKVYDVDTDEEYTVFRLEGVSGSFVLGVRDAYVSLLEDVRDHCSTERIYLTDQSARIAAEIFARYGVSPEFLWKKFPHYCVFRNADSRKWFAILMDLDRSKVAPEESGLTDVMNVKLGERTAEFAAKGARPCFHMNDKNWVSILLDDRLSDNLILDMLEISYRLSFGKKKRAPTV